MEKIMKDSILERLKAQNGHVGFYYKNMVTGEELEYQADEKFMAASVIKLPMFMCIAKWASEGECSMADKITVREKDKMPICGALTLISGEYDVDIRSLCNLMISISDNTATNMLINYFGVERYKEEFERMGLKNTELNRLLFNPEASAKGIQNYIAPKEIGMLLEKVYRRSFVNEQVSKDIEDTLMLQQINHKICGALCGDIPVAHKTGEDDNLSNDVGIVYAPQPFVVCFASHNTHVPTFENLIRTVSAELVAECSR